jgi:hypothetical protein
VPSSRVPRGSRTPLIASQYPPRSARPGSRW